MFSAGLRGLYYDFTLGYASVSAYMRSLPKLDANLFKFGQPVDEDVTPSKFLYPSDGSKWPPMIANGLGTSHFAAIWAGYFVAPLTGDYIFATVSDGMSLSVWFLWSVWFL